MASPNPQSPPRQKTKISHESPAHVKRVHSSRSYQGGILEEAKLAVLEDLGPDIPQITVQAFMDFLAPPQPEFDLEATMETLKTHGILTASGRWRAFNTEPKNQTGGEDAIFKPMEDVFNGVVDAIIANSNSKLTADNRSVDFLQNPYMTPTSTVRHNATRPDGYMLVKDRPKSKNLSWADIVLSCEYKRAEGVADLDDDVRKCLWSMQHIMADDPCHRATFGMTIENAATRLWFCCRSSVIVSETFDFIAEPKWLVKLFAGFAFADKKSLGLDPTIERVPGKPTELIITVHPDDDKKTPEKTHKRFRTTKVISAYGAEPLRGRGTRVFEAIEIDKDGRAKGSAVVLKDIWIDHDRTREGAILAQICKDAGEKDKILVKKYFLTTVCHGDVWMEPGVIDDTEKGIMRGFEASKDNLFQLQRQKLMTTSENSAPGSEPLRAMSRLHAPHPILKYSHKTHYRIVFEEMGTTIDRIISLPDVMTILTETATALQLLRKLGWVHRDVSIGNILSYEGGAKLADLEYAKKMDDAGGGHNMRTASGTMHFMSVEVAAHKFLFQPSQPGTLPPMWEINGHEPAELPFAYNHLHDLESLWWVAVWIVFYHNFCDPRQPNEVPLPNLKEVADQLQLAKTLFPPSMLDFSRRDNFHSGFLQVCKKLPNNKGTISHTLNTLRRYLIQDYTNVESMLQHSIDLTASKDVIYENFRYAFTRLREAYPDVTMTFIPDIHAQLSGPLKRQRVESINDTGGPTQKRR